MTEKRRPQRAGETITSVGSGRRRRDGMKITSVECCVVRCPATWAVRRRFSPAKPWTHLEILLVKVDTEDGLVGWGEAFGHAAIPATKAALDTIVAPLVIGRDADRHQRADTRHPAFRASARPQRSVRLCVFRHRDRAVGLCSENARHSRSTGCLAASNAPAELEAYASLLRYSNDLELVARNTAAACARGYRHIKLHEIDARSRARRQEAPRAPTMRASCST